MLKGSKGIFYLHYIELFSSLFLRVCLLNSWERLPCRKTNLFWDPAACNISSFSAGSEPWAQVVRWVASLAPAKCESLDFGGVKFHEVPGVAKTHHFVLLWLDIGDLSFNVKYLNAQGCTGGFELSADQQKGRLGVVHRSLNPSDEWQANWFLNWTLGMFHINWASEVPQAC